MSQESGVEQPSIQQLLTGILKVLERIDTKVAVQDEQLQMLNAIVRGRDAFHEGARSDARTDSAELDRSSGPLAPISRRSTRKKAKISYRDWSLHDLRGHLDDEFSVFLQGHLGDWCKIPRDSRIPLSFSKYGEDASFFNRFESYRFAPTASKYSAARLKAVHAFDTAHRRYPGNDFLVVDFASQHNHILYRIGETALGDDLLLDVTKDHLSAPWSRFILYQGMTTGTSMKLSETLRTKDTPIPYFEKAAGFSGLWGHINNHLQNRERNATSNPYLDKSIGFTTTFYEIMRPPDEAPELWRHGPLYDNPLGRMFRKCSYTFYSLSSANLSEDVEVDVRTSIGHWTILVLCPSHFFDASNTSFPMAKISTHEKHILSHVLGRLTKLGAEMHLIAQGLQRIGQRWADFQSFFEYILDSGDSLMRPTEHDNLLFDDGAFSRSRRYFWAIDCLSEFENNINDNMLQWELWKKAHVEQPLKENLLTEIELTQYKSAEQQFRVLENQKQYFRQKLTATVALRDALFNASAVIESRASTHLGENVKLLTFVSIFFLPLSFSSSLFSVTSYGTPFIATIASIGLVTYLIVLNLNTIVHGSYSLYNSQKRHLIRAMKADSSESWKRRGKRFEVFKPKHESVRPSEWFLPVYMIRLAGRLGWSGWRGENRVVEGGEGNAWVALGRMVPERKKGWWFRKQPKRQEPRPREEEGWVL